MSTPADMGGLKEYRHRLEETMATLIVASTTSGAGKTALAAGLKALLERDDEIYASGIDVVEGSSGDPTADLRLAEESDALVVLVCGYNDDARAAAAEYGSRLAGVVINNVPVYRRNEVETRIAPQIAAAGVKLIGWLPEDRRLLAPTVDLVAEHMGGTVAACEDNANTLIDNFLIGGLVLDWGPHYFGSQDNVGVVVRGDRPDVQLAALQTDTVRALVLTKGIPPIEYVYYEADQRGIPIVVVPDDTAAAAAKLETLLPRIGFDHEDKLSRVVELIESHLDLDAIRVAASQPATR